MKPDHSRFTRVTRLLVSFASLQAATQLASGLAGVLAVRALPIPSFAVYAIATSVLTSLNVLSDVGVTTVVMARAGQFHANHLRLAVLGETARRFRLRLTIPAVLVGGPLLYLSLGSGRPSLSACALILVILAVSLLLQLSSSIDGALLLVLLQSDAQLTAQLVAASLRLVGMATLLALVPNYLMALAINCAATCVQLWFQRRSIRRLLPGTRDINDDDRHSFRDFVRRQFPNAIHFAFSSQITMWLISILGSATVVANVGALGRLTGIIVLLQSGVVTLVAPRMARLAEPRLLIRRYAQVIGATAALSTLALLATFIAPTALIWIIGPKYSSLAAFLPLAMSAAAAYLLSTTLYTLNSSRAWVMSPAVAIPFTLGVQGLGLWLVSVSDTRGALIFGLINTLPPLLMGAFLAWKHLRELPGLRPQLLTGMAP